MTFERIDRLVTNERFAFQAWNDNYGKGVWAAVGTFDLQIDVVREASSDGDLDMIPAMNYVFSADWLPYVTGRTLAEAMANLEARLASLPQDQLSKDSDWSRLVYDAIEKMRELKADQLGELPATFEEACDKLAQER
ncbi:hypothetical protein [Aquitalea palustris]|uniref:hypothetical protein n=1 Tax=Aquitalea palustris TaxID=2480983 RepID=UPI001CF04EA1|nr:hypothetical protein [Aquitalea palustris]